MSTGRPVLSPDRPPSSTVHPHVTHRVPGRRPSALRMTGLGLALPSCSTRSATGRRRGRAAAPAPDLDREACRLRSGGRQADRVPVPDRRRRGNQRASWHAESGMSRCRSPRRWRAAAHHRSCKRACGTAQRYDDAWQISGRVDVVDCPLWTIVGSAVGGRVVSYTAELAVQAATGCMEHSQPAHLAARAEDGVIEVTSVRNRGTPAAFMPSQTRLWCLVLVLLHGRCVNV